MNILQMTSTLAQVAAANPNLSTLSKALSISGLNIPSGTYTIFAPTNQAFTGLSSGSLQTLMTNTGKLTNILQYHVVPGQYSYQDLAGLAGTNLTTLNGLSLPVTMNAGGQVAVGGVPLQDKGTFFNDGIVYTINSILLPPGDPIGDATTTTIAPGQYTVAKGGKGGKSGWSWFWIIIIILLIVIFLAWLINRNKQIFVVKQAPALAGAQPAIGGWVQESVSSGISDTGLSYPGYLYGL